MNYAKVTSVQIVDLRPVQSPRTALVAFENSKFAIGAHWDILGIPAFNH
jgi:hypothetical protein